MGNLPRWDEKLAERSHSGDMTLLTRWGFACGPTEVAHSVSQVEEMYGKALAQRDSWEFPADGVVVKVNPFECQQSMGSDARSPRWALAWKFPAAAASSTLKAIHWQVGCGTLGTDPR